VQQDATLQYLEECNRMLHYNTLKNATGCYTSIFGRVQQDATIQYLEECNRMLHYNTWKSATGCYTTILGQDVGWSLDVRSTVVVKHW
jgi:hypothetical protein